MENCANILLLGKTGVGKSSFINYFIGKPLAKVGDGRPITPYLTPYEIKDGKYPIQIFDTKGLESMDAHKQLDEIIEVVKERNNGDNVIDWFHTIFYCVSMANKFEDFEARFIRQLREEISQHIHIILTQCDAVRPDVIGKMRTKITNDIGNMEGIQIFEVVSISKKKRNGEVVEPRGTEEISESVFELLVGDIAYKVSVSYAKELRKAWYKIVTQFCDELDAFIRKSITPFNQMSLLVDGGKTVQDQNQILYQKVSRLALLISEKDKEIRVSKYMSDTSLINVKTRIVGVLIDTNKRFEKILQPVGQLYESYKGIVTQSYVEKAHLAFSDASEWLDVSVLSNIVSSLSVIRMFPKLSRYIDKNGNYIGKNSILDYGNTFGSYVDDLFHLDTARKKLIHDTKARMMDEWIPSEAAIKERAYRIIVDFLI